MSIPALSAALFFASTSLSPAGLNPAGAPPEAHVATTAPVADRAMDMPRAPQRDSAGWRAEDEHTEALLATEATPVAQPPKITGQEEEDIVVSAHLRPPPGDPAIELNMASFAATQAVDDALVRPAALAYSRIVPDPIRDGIRNFLDHLTEPVVFVNFLLQHKIGKAFETLGRFALNSTVGVLGIFDVAKRKPFKLPKRPNGFADTLGFYGVKPGPFLYLPLVGPTTVRDLIGIVLNRSFLPFAFGKPFNRPVFYIPSSTLGQLDKRDQFDEEIQARKGDARGAYTATREDYLERRQEQIDSLRGKRKAPSPPVSSGAARPQQ